VGLIAAETEHFVLSHFPFPISFPLLICNSSIIILSHVLYLHTHVLYLQTQAFLSVVPSYLLIVPLFTNRFFRMYLSALHVVFFLAASGVKATAVVAQRAPSSDLVVRDTISQGVCISLSSFLKDEVHMLMSNRSGLFKQVVLQTRAIHAEMAPIARFLFTAILSSTMIK
jgi:hypothetical protein